MQINAQSGVMQAAVLSDKTVAAPRAAAVQPSSTDTVRISAAALETLAGGSPELNVSGAYRPPWPPKFNPTA